MSQKYQIFVRNWWKRNPSYPDGLEPDSGARKTKLCICEGIDEARRICKQYNETHKPGRLSRKAEFTSI